MADRRLGIVIEAESDLEGVAQARSALDGFSKGGITAMDKLGSRVVALQTATAKLRGELVQNQKAQAELDKAVEKGSVTVAQHVQMKQQLTQREGQLTSSLKLSRLELSANSQQMAALNRQAVDAQQKAQLLASQFGVALPAALGRFITQTKAAQGALAAMFTVGIIATFVAAAVGGLVVIARHGTEVWDILRRIPEAFRAGAYNLEALREQLAGFLGVETELGSARRVGMIRVGAAAEAKKIESQIGFVGLDEIGKLQRQLAEAQAKSAGGLPEQQRAHDAQVALIQAQLNEVVQKRAAKSAELIAQARGRTVSLVDITSVPGHTSPEQFSREQREAIKQYEAERDALNKLGELHEKAELSRLDPNRRAVMEIYLNEKRLVEDIVKLRNDGLISEEQFQDARVALAMDADAQMREAVRNYGRELESLFDRTIGAAKSWGDALKNIWREVMNYWKRQAFDTLAALLMGQRQGVGTGTSTIGFPGGATAGGGGLLGGLGTIFTGGGGMGPGGTPPFIGSGFLMGTFPGAVSTGGGGGTTAAALGFPSTMPLGDILGRVFSHGANLPGGISISGPDMAALGLTRGMATVGNRNRAISTLGGAGSGAMIGMSVGGPIGAGIGALIGAGIGFFSGGGGKEDEQNAAIANQGFAQIWAAVEDYRRHRRDFASAMDTVNSTWAQMESSFSKRSWATGQRRYYEMAVSELRQIEDERNRRRSVMGGLAVPEFASGGLVMGGGGGGLAILHPGEFVMNSSAVQRLGVSLLEGLNTTAPAAAASEGYALTVWTPSKEWAAEVVAKGVPVVINRGGKASRMLKG